MKKLIAIVVSSFIVMVAQAQHEHNETKKPAPKTQKASKKKPAPAKKAGTVVKDTVPKQKNKVAKDTSVHLYQHQLGDSVSHLHQMPDTIHPSMHAGHDMEQMGSMSHAFSLNLPMERNGSGTGWLPDNSAMYGYMFHSPKWMYMVHGNVFLRYNSQDFSNKGSRGDVKFDAPNWVMFMGQRKIRKNGLFHFSTMLSLDAMVAGKTGYPLLFQTGETANGEPLVDRQHPHDLFSELSVSYAHALSKNIDVFIYIGYPGEPAIGPVAFMHRPSALDNPNAPLSHHWTDATHITFGVATLGLRLGDFKIEGSSFTGREPDEDRYGFDKPRFDSWSGRLSYNPDKNWAMQVSHGFIKNPEPLHANENVLRTTASAIYGIPIGNQHRIDATLVWGMNKKKGISGENAFLLEGAWRKKSNALYSRYEFTQKSAEELVLENHFDEHRIFPVHTFTIGNNYDIFNLGATRFAIGGQLSFYKAPAELDFIYGKNPLAFQVYIRLYPAVMKM